MAKKVDKNQALIVRDLRKLGATVRSTADLGKGAPDIMVCWGRQPGRNYLFEIKDPMQPPSKRKLTPAEVEWHKEWRAGGGQVDVILTTEDALRVMRNGALK